MSASLLLPEGQMAALEQAYAQPSRAYHDFSHVGEVLRHYEAVAAGHDLLLPFEGQFLGRGGVPLIADEDAAMGARTDAGIFAITPVEQIVPAFLARSGMVGDFVRRQARRPGQRLRCFVKPGGDIVVGNGQPALGVEQRIGRLRFDGELIERQMIGAEAERFLQFGAPRRICLIGAGIDQIQRNTVEHGLRHFQRRFGLSDIVQAAQFFQVGIV